MICKIKLTDFLPNVLLILTLSVGVALHNTINAQDIKHNQAWFDISTRIPLGKNFSLTPEAGYRSEPSLLLNQVYLRTYFTYSPHKLVKLSVWAAHFNSWKPENIRASEVRTSQFVSLNWPEVAGFRFEHRLGLDQRMFYTADYDLRKLVHRSRFRIALYTPGFSVFGGGRDFYANVSFEVLRNINQREEAYWIDHDWITLVLGYKLSESLKMETNLLMINLLDPIDHKFDREITVVRFRMKYSFH